MTQIRKSKALSLYFKMAVLAELLSETISDVEHANRDKRYKLSKMVVQGKDLLNQTRKFSERIIEVGFEKKNTHGDLVLEFNQLVLQIEKELSHKIDTAIRKSNINF